MAVPYWVQDAIFYQIFPDRFANGERKNDPPNVQPWGAEPTSWGFQGGDIRGIINRIDYLLDLGITAIYLNPIFQSPSNHRYNASDYFKIDPKLGDIEDFRALLEVAHRNGVRIILDGVFNHCGRGFFAFSDILENQANSPYKDWFHVKSFPIDAYAPGADSNYLTWWGIKSMPKFNTNNPAVRRYIFDVARYWIDQGADGWRLDVPNEIEDDTFWAEFRYVVKSSNRDAYILGEIWTADPRWVGEDHFDGLMNYPLRDCLLRMLSAQKQDTKDCAARFEELMKIYPRPNVYAMYVPLGSHDTERILTELEGDVKLLKLAYSLQFAFPGAPAIYYGDEIGLQGGKDPSCRGTFPWDQSLWDADLREWVKLLIANRKRFVSLRRGDFSTVFTDDRRRCYAFARRLGEEKILVIVNASETRRQLRIPVHALGWSDGQILHNLLGTEEYLVSGDTLNVTMMPTHGVWVH